MQKTKRKAQMEMIGIAIVVVLLVLGMAFVFRALTKPPKKTHERFIKEQTAQSILIAIGRSSTYGTGCPAGLDFTELMQDCAENVESIDYLYSGGSYISCYVSSNCHDCGSLIDSCYAVNSSLKHNVFDETLAIQKLPYRFFLYKPSVTDDYTEDYILYISDGNCNNEYIRTRRIFNVEKPGELTLPLPSGKTVNARLEICTPASRG